MVDATTSHSPPTQHHQLPFSRHPLSITTPNFDATRVSVFRVTKQIFPQLSPSLSTFLVIKVTINRQTTPHPHLIPDQTCSFQTPEPPHIRKLEYRESFSKNNHETTQTLQTDRYQIVSRKNRRCCRRTLHRRQLLKLQTPAHHESLTYNRQLACRECSHILRRFPTTWKGPISYRWRG